MAKTRYENPPKKITPDRQRRIEQANAICQEYADQGLVLTLRQLYYQFVARGLLDENSQKEYNRIKTLCSDARMWGLMDWNYLIDRTRNRRSRPFWKSPEHMLGESAEQFHRDLWAPQKKRVEVWIEKDAAIGVIESVCNANSVPYFSTRGYPSMSEMHSAAQRIRYHIEDGEQVHILHIGDHDPSGVDMSRDIEDRLRKFLTVDWRGLHDRLCLTRGQINASMRQHMRDHNNEEWGKKEDPDAPPPILIGDHEQPFSFQRIALTMDQIRQYSPPPNWAKITDSRSKDYIAEYGDQSWELDALEPNVLVGLLQRHFDLIRDEDLWMEADFQMEEERKILQGLKDYYGEVKDLIETRQAVATDG